MPHDPAKRPIQISNNQRQFSFETVPHQPKLAIFQKIINVLLENKVGSMQLGTNHIHILSTVWKKIQFTVIVCCLFPTGPNRKNAEEGKWYPSVA